MQFTTDQKQFAAAIATVSRATATKTSMPILTNILLQARHGALRLVGTNFEIGIARTIPCDVSMEGSLTIPGHRLGEWVVAVDDKLVTCALDPKVLSLRLSGGRSKATLRGIDAEDFPELPTAQGAPTATIDPLELRQAVAAVAFAAANDQSRPVLSGVCCTFAGDRLTISAADGFRMAVRDVYLPSPVETPVTVIVPAKALQALAAVMGEADAPVELHIPKARNQMIARAPGLEFVTRLIDGAFPDWRQIIPSEWVTRTVVGREALLQAVKLAGIFAKDNNHVVVVDLSTTPERGMSLTVSATAAEFGDNSANLDAAYQGPDDRFALNGTFLADALRALRGAEVALESRGSGGPIAVKGVTDEDGQHVIMPMSLSSYQAPSDPGPDGGEQAPAPAEKVAA